MVMTCRLSGLPGGYSRDFYAGGSGRSLVTKEAEREQARRLRERIRNRKRAAKRQEAETALIESLTTAPVATIPKKSRPWWL